jgi:hypothetical protein
MARVNIPGIGPTDFPDHLSDKEILQQAKAMQESAYYDPRDQGIGQLLKGGAQRSWEGLKGSVMEELPALAASSLGFNETAKNLLQKYQERMEGVSAANPAAYSSYKDIRGVGDVLPFLAESAGELAPTAASFIGGAGIGTQLGKFAAKKGLERFAEEELAGELAKRGIVGDAAAAKFQNRVTQAALTKGADIGSKIGLVGTSAATNIPDTFQQIYQDTGKLEPGIALTIGSLVAALDTYLPEKILHQLGSAGKKQLAAELLNKSEIVPTTWKKAFIGETLKTTAGEALTEGGQQALQNLASSMADPSHPFFTPQNIDSIITSALKGAVGGAGLGAPGAAVQARNIKAQTQQAYDTQQAANAQPAVTPPIPAPTGQVPLTPEQIREQKQLAAAQQIHGDLFGQPVPQRPTNTFPVGQEETQIPATLAPPTGELNLQGAPVQGELDLRPAETTPAPAQNTVLDADTLKGTGLKAQSGFFRQLVGKDMANPEDQKAIGEVLARVRSNPNLTLETKKAVETIAMNAFNALATQQEMFGPRGGVLKGADNGRVQPRTNVETDRTSPEVPVEQVPTESTEGAGEPEQRGVAPTAEPVSELGAREEVQPDTLVPEETPSETETTAKAEPTETPVETPVAEEVPAQTYDRSPETLKLLQNHVEQLKQDFLLSKDPETRAAIKAEKEAVEKEIAQGKYQVGDFVGPRNMYRGDVQKLAKNFRAALNKMGLNNVALNLEKVLMNKDGSFVQGQYLNKVINIALNSNNIWNTLNHEALHAMRELGFFSNADWNVLSNMARSLWIKKYDIESKYNKETHPELSKNDLKNLQIEEAIAEAFADYMGQTPKVQSIMDKVIDAVRKFGNWLSGYGFKNAEDIFGGAASGELAKSRADIISRFDKMVDELAAKYPTPKYQVANAQDVFKGTDKLINAIPYLNDNQKNALSGAIGGSSNFAKSTLLSMLPQHALSDIAEKYFPGLAKQFNRLIDQCSGFASKLNGGIDAVIQEAKKAIKASSQQRETFDKIIGRSTLEEVDPSEQSNREKYKNDPDKLKAFDELRAEFIKLAPVWKQLYTTMRDSYKGMYDEIIKAIEERIDATNISEESKILVKKDIMDKLSKRGMIEPYFALGREGDHWLASDYTDRDGQKQYTVEAFKSTRERDMRKAELLKLDPNARIDAYEQLSQVNYRNAPSGSFVNSVLNIMENNGVPQDAIDQMMHLFISTLPETAFAKSFQKRKGTAGFNQNSIATFERKMRSMARQVATMKYNPKLSKVLNDMGEQTVIAGRTGEGNALQKQYYDEFAKRLKYVLNPTKNDFGSILTSAAFTYTLGFNLSSAIVNMANVPMIVMPYLKGKYGDASVVGALGNATKVFAGSGIKTNMEVIGGKGRTTEMNVMPSISNYAPDSAMGKKYATLIRIASEQGQLNRSQLYELINGDTRTGIMAKFNAMSGWMFHHGERYNREVTMVAAYDLEMQRLANDIKSGKITQEEAETKAANDSIYVNELTNGGISAASAPRIAQNPVGKMFFMYKRYGVSMYYMMFKTFNEATQGADPESRKAAWRQMGGLVGMSALMAGAQGIPMFGALSLLYGLFSDDDDEDLHTVVRKYLGEFLYKGPIEYMTNLSIASRITLNDLIIRDNSSGSSASTFSQQAMEALGGPVFGVSDRIQRGLSKMNQGHIERAMEDLLPSAIANGFKAYRYATQGTTTLRGDPITGDVSAYNAAAQLLGFAPADYSRQLEISATEKGIDKTISDRTSKIMQRYYIAKREGDYDGMDDMRQRLIDLGQKHPEIGITAGNVGIKLAKSVKAQDKASKEMIAGVRYNKKRLAVVKQSMDEYDPD